MDGEVIVPLTLFHPKNMYLFHHVMGCLCLFFSAFSFPTSVCVSSTLRLSNFAVFFPAIVIFKVGMIFLLVVVNFQLCVSLPT